MKYLYLAFKRAMRTVYVPVILLICAATAFFAPLMSKEEELPMAGVYSADNSEMARRTVDYLLDNLFEECEDEETLREKIARGEYNCGVVIYEDFEKRIKNCDSEGLVLYLTTPSSFTPIIYQNHIMTAVYKEYAPYLTASLISDEHFVDHEVVDRYFDMMSEGGRFTFEVMREDNVTVGENERAFAYTVGLSALLIFALIMYGVCSTVAVDLESMKDRIGAGKTIRYSVIPSLAVRAVGVILAFSAGILLSAAYSGNTELIRVIGAVAVYTLLVTGFGVIVAAVCRQVKAIQTVTFFILVAGLMLCPIYYDVSVLLPWIEVFRNIIPPYWLWICDESILVMSAVTVVVLPGSFALLYMIARKRK